MKRTIFLVAAAAALLVSGSASAASAGHGWYSGLGLTPQMTQPDTLSFAPTDVGRTLADQVSDYDEQGFSIASAYILISDFDSPVALVYHDSPTGRHLAALVMDDEGVAQIGWNDRRLMMLNRRNVGIDI